MRKGTGETLRLMFVAGEDSGDAHAAALVRALRERAPATRFELFGAAGMRMREAGVEPTVREDDLAIMGILEVARALPRFLAAYRDLKRAARERRPEAVVLVDWPDFNLPLARALKRRGTRVIYYISPQLWAWRARRVRRIRRDVDLLLAILPFEPAWYEGRGVRHVEFVGHPLVGEVRPRLTRAEFCARHGLDPQLPVIALLPGSRRKEFERILPPMLDASCQLARTTHEGAQFVVALGVNRTNEEAERLIAASAIDRTEGLRERVRLVRGETREVLAAADAAAVASGTATLEAALTCTPMVVVYKESAINWHVLGSLIDVEHYGLVNLIAGERLAVELMQDELTGPRLAAELRTLLDAQHNAHMRARLREATARLGSGGASLRAADAVLRAVRSWRQEQPGS